MIPRWLRPWHVYLFVFVLLSLLVSFLLVFGTEAAALPNTNTLAPAQLPRKAFP